MATKQLKCQIRPYKEMTMTYQLELTIYLENGKTDYDFVQVPANSRQEAIEGQARCLNNRIEKAKAGNKIWKHYANWLGFELK